MRITCQRIIPLIVLGLSTLCSAQGQELPLKTFRGEFPGVDSIHATITVPYGDMVFRLEHKKAPQTVENFVTLAKAGFYNGLKFHRVIPGFVAQGGDPQGNGQGGPGYRIIDETDTTRNNLKHVAGALSMANAGPNTGGSQFFVVQAAQQHLDGKHTVFGQLVSGWDVPYLIEAEDPMLKVTIQEFRSGAPAAAPVKAPVAPAKASAAAPSAPAKAPAVAPAAPAKAPAVAPTAPKK